MYLILNDETYTIIGMNLSNLCAMRKQNLIFKLRSSYSVTGSRLHQNRLLKNEKKKSITRFVKVDPQGKDE